MFAAKLADMMFVSLLFVLLVLVPVLLATVRPSAAVAIATVLKAVAEVIRAFRGHRC